VDQSRPLWGRIFTFTFQVLPESLLNIDSFFTLDRLDASVKSTLDFDTQIAVTQEMMRFHDAKWVKAKNLKNKSSGQNQ
jgi:hypothetical protein